MPDLHIFKAQVGMFNPTDLPQQNVAIHYAQNPVRYRRVDYVEAIPPHQCIDLGAIAATTQGNRQNVTNLEMADGEFGLFRWYILDDAQVMLFHPAGVAKAQLRNLQVPYDMNVLFEDPNLVSTEIAVWENNRPAMQPINGHAFALGAVRIKALGYRFHVVGALPVTAEEMKVVAQLKPENVKLSETQLMEKAFVEGRLPVTHVWCSGRAIGD